MSVLQPAQPLLEWSFPLFRVGRIAVRAHWTLLAYMLFEAISLASRLPLWCVPVIIAIITVSVLLHELGHAFAARMVGGDCRKIVLWMLGGLAECERPFRPWPVAAVAAAGPAVNAAIYAGCELFLRVWHPEQAGNSSEWAVFLLRYASGFNFFLMWFNLLPGIPLDGSRVLTAGVWTVFGLRAAMRTSLIVSYPVVIGLFVWACYDRSMLLLFLSLWMFSATVQEHAALRQGWSTQGFEPAYGDAPSPFARWLSRRRRHRRARLDAKAAADRETVDDLLAKVSANGLTSLTKRERATLEAYSRRERQRLGRM